jgi:hypothetical protein
MMNTIRRDELHTLISALVDRTASEGEIAKLSQWLEHDAEARRFYIRYLDMHAHLENGPDAGSGVSRRSVPWAAAAAVTAIAMSLLAAWLVPSMGRRIDAERPAAAAVAEPLARGYVSTVAFASPGAQLNGVDVVAGMRLAPGRFSLTTGAIDIQFDGGARIVFDGASQFTVLSRRSLAIERGTFVFRGDQTCEPITITTPRSVYEDIGTRYAGMVGDDTDELHVADGAVRRCRPEAGGTAAPELITAGNGRRYGTRGGNPIPLDQALLDRAVTGGPESRQDRLPTVVESFEGGSGRIGGRLSGFGWKGPWISHTSFPELPLVSPGLSGEGSVAVRHDATGQPRDQWRTAAHRLLETPIDLSQDGIWYLRFLVRRGPAVPKDPHLAMVVLRSYGLTIEEEIERMTKLTLAVAREEAAFIGLANTRVRASLPQLPGQTYAVVAKIVAGRTNPDQVFMRVMGADRLAGAAEPADWSLVSESIDTDARLDQVSLEFASGGRIEFGEFRIGPTWESVSRPIPR